MIYFGWSEFDPLEGSATSIDPLRSLAHSVRLGDLVFPGSSGRVWRARYVSALCFLLKHSRLERGQDYKTNYLKYRKLENAFILCLNHLKKKYVDSYDFNRIIGLDKADQLVRNNPGKVHINGDILANQMNLGPLGVHSVFLKSLELVDDDRELVLLPRGEELAEIYERSLDVDAEKFLAPLRAANVRRVEMENFDSLSDKILFELRKPSQKKESEKIRDLIYEDATREQLFRDILSISKRKNKSEADLINDLPKLKSPLKKKYDLINAYDCFQRLLHHYFTVIRQVSADDFVFAIDKRINLKDAFVASKEKIKSQAGVLLTAAEDFLESFEDDDGFLAELREFTNTVKDSLKDHVEFTTFLIEFHQSHQKAKGKAPWIRMLSAKSVEVHPSNGFDDQLPSLTEFMGQNIHSYRLSNCSKMIDDLGLGG